MERRKVDPRDVGFLAEIERAFKALVATRKVPREGDILPAKSQKSTDLSTISSRNTWSTKTKVLAGISLGALALAGVALIRKKFTNKVGKDSTKDDIVFTNIFSRDDKDTRSLSRSKTGK